MTLLRTRPAYERVESGDLGDGYGDGVELLDHKHRTTSSADFDSIIEKAGKDDGAQDQADEALLGEKQPHRSRISGWRVGAFAAGLTTCIIVLVNTALTTWIMTRPDYRDEDGWRIMFEGSCQTAKETSRWLHFVINALSTVLLGASNYCMQVLSSPTRSELVRAHNKKYWLHIGVPNTRNLRHIGKDRSLLCVLLFLSSVPLHIIFNSVIFANIQANHYTALPVTPAFLNGAEYNTTGLFGVDDAAKDKVNQTATDLRSKFQDLMAQENGTQELPTADCLDAYNNQYVSKYGHVLLVQDEVVWHNPDKWAPSWRFENASKHPDYFVWFELSTLNYTETYNMWHQDGRANPRDRFPFDSNPSEFPSNGWLCPSRSTIDCDTNSAVEVPDRTTWAPYGSPVHHCVVELVNEQCRLQFSPKIATAVIICNIIKAVCIITMLVRNRAHYLVTLGDAIACFLDDPDPETRNRCLHGKALMVKEWNWMTTHGHTDPKTITVEPEIYAPTPDRWAKAASKRRWWTTYLLYLLSLILAAVAISASLKGMPTSPSALWAVGFGELRGNNLLSLSTSTMSAIFLANAPQALLSYLYVAFNALYTCMLVAREYATFAHARKPLRVTTPRGNQRSTYWLQLPYRYALPLTLASGLLHWLASQSLFMIAVTILDADRRPAEKMATCGYSPVAIILTTVVGSVIVLGGLGMAMRRYPPRMPLASSCSAAISAACHPPVGDGGAALQPVQWGVCGEEGEVGHLSFSGGEVGVPVRGRRYA